jgi:hypothetical protein
VEEFGGGEGLARVEGGEFHMEHVVLSLCLGWIRTNEEKKR